ncbi:RFC checkpoint protein Rad17, partial [Coemansia erecta]
TRTHNTRSRSKVDNDSRYKAEQRSAAGKVVVLASSPESVPDDKELADDMDIDIDIDIDIDSDLEALIEECSQPEKQHFTSSSGSGSQKSNSLSQLSKQAERTRKQVNKNSSSHVVKRRAITDRPQFMLTGSRSQTSLLQTEPAAKQWSAFPIERKGDSFGIGDKSSDDGTDDRGQVWWQRYEPKEVSELAVHSAKIAQVRGWLEMAADAAISGGKDGSRFFRILVVEGPAGTCKSTCVRVLARELSLDVVEWVNPLSGMASAAGQLEPEDSSDASVVRQFADFLMRAERYSTLALSRQDSEIIGSYDSLQSQEGSRGRIILVDDIPNIGHRETRESFRSALLRFVSLSVQRSCPMVIVVTEAFAEQQTLDVDVAGSGHGLIRRFRESDTAANSNVTVWSAADVIPSSVYNSPFCQTIKFNPVAPTIVAKGLKRILRLRAGYGNVVGSQVKFSPASTSMVKAISEQCCGDMRSAVTMLQLTQQTQSYMDSVDDLVDKPGSRKRGRSRAKIVDVMSGTSVGSYSGESRRVTLDLFHALGKVLYAKREMPRKSAISSGRARGRLESDPFDILDRVPTDLSTFQLFVHENSMDFCNSIEEAAAASDLFSEADLFTSTGRKTSGSRSIADTYSAILAIAGFMDVRGHPQYPLNGIDESLSQRPPSERAFGMGAIRKPYFFESFRQQMAYSKLWSDTLAAQSLSSGMSFAGLPMHEVLALWIRIALGRGQISGISADLLQRLAGLAMVDADSIAEASVGTDIGTVGLERSTEKLVLSDDDIGEFSD